MRICPSCHLEYHDDTEKCVVDGVPLEEARDPRIGRLLGGRYYVDAPLGEGGMATVYRAHHTLIGRPIAIKVLHVHLARDEVLRERFRREARAAATIAHPNVIEIFDFGETEDGCPFLVMELLEGEPLRKTIERGPMRVADVLSVARAVARGLARAHDLGIVHRDLKPENVFVRVDADGRMQAKVVDFGIALSKSDERLTSAGSLVGTPQYLAPERIQGVESGPPSDVYSFGAMLFEMLVGRPPFEGPDLPAMLLAHLENPPVAPSAALPGLTKDFDALVLAMLAKNPAERPVDAHAVGRELDAIGARYASGAGPTPIAPPIVDEDAREGKGPAARPPPLTLERWERRALVFEHMLRRAYPEGGAPEPLATLVRGIAEDVAREGALRSTRLQQQTALELVDVRTRERREQLGRAVHLLGTDLSAARDQVREIEARLAAKKAELEDLEFQIDTLRKKLAEVESEHDAQRSEVDRALRESGHELEALERRLGERSRSFLEAVRALPETAALVADLEHDLA